MQAAAYYTNCPHVVWTSADGVGWRVPWQRSSFKSSRRRCNSRCHHTCQVYFRVAGVADEPAQFIEGLTATIFCIVMCACVSLCSGIDSPVLLMPLLCLWWCARHCWRLWLVFRADTICFCRPACLQELMIPLGLCRPIITIPISVNKVVALVRRTHCLTADAHM
jgi:hypothetical protein